MALQVWLPLNGNIKNQGVSGATFTSVGTLSYGVGKVTSKCGTFSGSNRINCSLVNLPNTSMSASIWIKSNLLTSGQYYYTFGLSTGSGYSTQQLSLALEYASSTTSKLVFIANGVSSLNTTININQWYHVVITYDGSTIRGYVNGVSIGNISTTARITATYFTIGCRAEGASSYLYYFKGSLNDFRLYDHCLSVKEVKNLAKGLILHYTLSRPQTNLLVNSNFTNGTTNWTADNSTMSVIDDTHFGKVLSFKASTANVGRVYNNVTGMFTSGNTYSYSFYAKASASVNIKPSRANADNGTTVTLTTVWTKYEGKITATATSNAFSFYSSNTTSTIYLANVKLELGNKATPWIPNSTDTMYNQLGLNLNIEDDTSGYGNNGTRTNINTWNTDTARYLSSMTFASNSYVKTNAINFNGTTNNYTISWWGNFSSASSAMFWGFSDGNRLNLYMASNYFYWNTGDNGQNPFYSSGTTQLSASPYADSKWHHFTIVGNGTSVILYIDGSQKATAKTYKNITGTIIYLNGWDTSTNYKFNGRMSDFRIYATALSADDVKELYNVGASIDKNGNMYCYEFVES